MLILKYILKSLLICCLIGITMSALVYHRSAHHENISEFYLRDRLGFALTVSSFLFVLMLVTFPLIVWLKKDKSRSKQISVDEIYDEQFNLLQNTNLFLRRKLFWVIGIVFIAALAFSVFDGFLK